MSNKDQSRAGMMKRAIEREIAETGDELVVHKTSRGRTNDLVRGVEAGEIYETQDEKRAFVTRTMAEMLEFWGKPCVKNTEEARERIIEYFERCLSQGIKPTVEELCLALGTYRSALHAWEAGQKKEIDPNLIKQAKEFIATFDAKAVSAGKLNPVTYIFRSKNYYGLRDQQEVVVQPKQLETTPKDMLIAQAEELPE